MERTMSLSARQELAASLATRYRQAKRPDKKKILDEFTAVTSYHRKYASALLKHTVQRKADAQVRRRLRRYNVRLRQRGVTSAAKCESALRILRARIECRLHERARFTRFDQPFMGVSIILCK
jgi:hypothetical protein